MINAYIERRNKTFQKEFIDNYEKNISDEYPEEYTFY